MIKKLAQRILSARSRELDAEELKLNDIQAQIELQAVDIGFQAQSSYAMSPVLTLHILNDLLINRRQRILEFGSGISTIYLAKAIKDNGLSAELFSVDENADWQSSIARRLESLGCADSVRLVAAPVVSGEARPWLDAKAIDAGISTRSGPFDCVIVDGPSTAGDRAASRRHVADYLEARACLAPAFSIFVDDTYRRAEREFALNWFDELGDVQFEDHDIYTVLTRGTAYTSRPRMHAHQWRVAQHRTRDD